MLRHRLREKEKEPKSRVAIIPTPTDPEHPEKPRKKNNQIWFNPIRNVYQLIVCNVYIRTMTIESATKKDHMGRGLYLCFFRGGGGLFHRHPTTKRQKGIQESRLVVQQLLKTRIYKYAGQFPAGRISAPTRKTLGSFFSLVASTSSPSQPVTEAYGAEGYGRRDARHHPHPFSYFLSVSTSFLPSFLPSQFPRTLYHLNHLFLEAISRKCVGLCAKRVENGLKMTGKLCPQHKT